MTLTATWINAESPGCPTLWMASDSRISDSDGPLIDEGAKLFELPLRCQSPGQSGFFDQVYVDTAVGIVCTGSTLVFQQVYATLVPTLRSLVGTGRVPAMGDIAGLIARLLTVLTRSLGSTRPHRLLSTGIVVAGADPSTGSLQAFEFIRDEDDEGLVAFEPVRLDLSEDRVHFRGHGGVVQRAEERLGAIRSEPAPGRPYHRAALNVIRELAQDEGCREVGGDVQIGYTVGHRFQRVATVTPEEVGKSRAQRLLNNVDVDDLGPVGPCHIGLDGMVSP